MQQLIKIHPKDTVAVALMPLPAGTTVKIEGEEFALKENVCQGHKIALIDLEPGTQVIKYGAPIGTAKERIEKGAWVHTHNMTTCLGKMLEYQYKPDDVEKKAEINTERKNAEFMGYRRTDGTVGVRNELWIIPTVGCVNNVAQAIERKAQNLMSDAIDAVAAFPHPYGCSQMGDDQEYTRKILVDLIRHPNAGGVLVLGLGCENSNIEVLKEYLDAYDKKRVKFLECQKAEDEIKEGLQLLKELAEYAGDFRRQPISCQELIVGMKCGGSDGLSGITANPTVGVFSDCLIACGGSTILTEVPEMFGAETLLMNRCQNEEVFQKTVTLINQFKEYFTRHQQTIYENPSPGNKQGGISTLEDKSLGCTQKSGSAPVVDVLDYAERVKKHGLNLLNAPGNDLVASTALAAAGAQIILFTTGRGTPFASPVPTIKISSNTLLFEKKKNWIDFNCGSVAEGISPQEMGKQLFEYVLEVASGRQVKSEEAGYHDMAIFKQGVTL